MRPTAIATILFVATAIVGSNGALAQKPTVATNFNSVPWCSYEAGGTDVALVQLPGVLDETTSVGGCVFDPWTGFELPERATVTIVDAVFGSIGGVLCTDVDADGVCGDTSKGEVDVGFCGSTDVPIGEPAHPWSFAVGVFVDSAASNLNHCGFVAHGTTGVISLSVYDVPDPDPCLSKTVHAHLETVGAGWNTIVDHQITFQYGSCPVQVWAAGSYCSAIYHATSECGTGVNEFGGTNWGNFQCDTTGCASDHLLQSWIWVENDGSFECTSYVSVSPPTLAEHCHQH